LIDSLVSLGLILVKKLLQLLVWFGLNQDFPDYLGPNCRGQGSLIDLVVSLPTRKRDFLPLI